MNKLKLIINSLLYIFSISCICIMIFKYLSSTIPFKINNIEISGNSYIEKNQIVKIIDSKINNKNIMNIKLKKINLELEKNNFIHSAKTYTKFPSTIVIEVEELNPLALFQKNDIIYFITKSKDLIEADYKSINYYINAPIITNLSDEEINLDKIRYLLIETLNNSDIIYEKLNEVQYLNEDIVLLLNNSTKIILQNKNYKNNLKKFFKFNEQVIIKNNMNIEDYNYINVSIPNQIITNEKKI